MDHRGELLRLRLDRDGVLSAVRAALGELGYRAENVSDEGAGTVGVRWYGATRVGDLSREEAEVIARRVTPAIAREHGLDTAAGKGLERTVAEALYGYFIAHTLGAGVDPGALRAECSRAVDAAARPLIGLDGARELAAALWRDLDTRSEQAI